MEMCLQALMSEEREVPVSVSTLAQMEQVLKRFDSLESNAQVGQCAIINIKIHTSLAISTNRNCFKCVFVGCGRR